VASTSLISNLVIVDDKIKIKIDYPNHIKNILYFYLYALCIDIKPNKFLKNIYKLMC
jgi:hypothetical protein